MRHPDLSRRAALAVPLGASLAAGSPAVAAPRDEPRRDVWRDAARGREVPVLIRAPAGSGPAPTVLISHGLGGSRDGLGYLGRALAAEGFLAIHLQHPGTDDSLWRGSDPRVAMAAAALAVQGAVDRLGDVLFALGRLPARADPERLAIAGHSYGAWVVQAMLGQRLPGGGRGMALPEPRLKAGIALSPTPARGFPPRLAYAAMTAPLLSVTGTGDDGWIEGVQARQRREVFENATNPGALAVLAGAVHSSFADEPAAGARWADPTFHARTAGLSVAFLRASLLREADAARFLRDGAPDLLAPGDELATRGL